MEKRAVTGTSGIIHTINVYLVKRDSLEQTVKQSVFILRMDMNASLCVTVVL